MKNISVPTPRSAFGLALLFSSFASVSAAQNAEFPVWNGFVFAPYGQVNMAYQSFDDGRQTTSNLVDNSNSNSRIGFYLEPADSGDGFAFQFESGLGLRPSS